MFRKMLLILSKRTTIKTSQMQSGNTILLHALPCFFILVVAEAFFLIKENRQTKLDLFSSVIIGLGAIPAAFIVKGPIIYSYTLLYKYRLFTLPMGCWWTWILCFFADDFSFYWFHRVSHKVRFLWASHMVHHSSESFSLSTSVRVPWTSNITGAFLFWIWMPLIGVEPAMVILMKSLSVFYQFFTHTEAVNKLPRWIELIFITPSHHRVHHASDEDYLDKNFGGNLIIWDKMLGTFKEESHKPKYGLTENIESSNPFAIALNGWKKIIVDFKKAKTFRDRLKCFLYTPRWKPNTTRS
jgi:sterol desaturase/sphingolipid hydroxylase (fatty acid hydroxylase superfamily)